MELGQIVAWAVLAVIFAWLGWILIATWRQMEQEARDAGLVAKRPRTRETRGWWRD